MTRVIGFLLVAPAVVLMAAVLSAPLVVSATSGDWSPAIAFYAPMLILGLAFVGLDLLK